MLKIISGGQAGVDRAALDAAVAAGLPVGGWCPRGRAAEDGPIPARYPLDETESADPSERTRRNIADADGTLILVPSGRARDMPDGTRLTVNNAIALGRPVREVDLAGDADVAVAETVRWLAAEKIATLNIAGPRASTAPDAYDAAHGFLTRLFARLAQL